MTERELATVLAALRHWQAEIAKAPPLPKGMEGYAERLYAKEIMHDHFEEQVPLAIFEIADLCIKLNTVYARPASQKQKERKLARALAKLTEAAEALMNDAEDRNEIRNDRGKLFPDWNRLEKAIGNANGLILKGE